MRRLRSKWLTVRGARFTATGVGAGGAIAGGSAAGVPSGSFVPKRGLLRIAGASAALALIFVSGAILSWPILDNWVLPYAFYLAIAASVSRRASILPPPCSPCDATLDNGMRGLFASPSEASRPPKGTVVLVTGPPGSGKSSRIDAAVGGRPFVYVNCRGFVEGSEVLYGALSTMVVKPLGPLGGLIMAYNKLFNAVADVLTMNQHHTHVSHILFAQNLQYLRAAMAKHQHHRPIVVVDQFEQLVELLRIHGLGSELSVFPLLLVKILLRSAVDEGLCDVLLVSDASVVRREAPSLGASTPLKRLLPELAGRCQFRSVSRPWPIADAGAGTGASPIPTTALVRQNDAAPGIMGVCLHALYASGSCVPEVVADAWRLPVNDVILACERLVDVGAMDAAFGDGLATRCSEEARGATWLDDAAAACGGSGTALHRAHVSSHWYAPLLSQTDLCGLINGVCSEVRVRRGQAPGAHRQKRKRPAAEDSAMRGVPQHRIVSLKRLVASTTRLGHGGFWSWLLSSTNTRCTTTPSVDALLLLQMSDALQLKNGMHCPPLNYH